jgi:hypothetical protein
MSLSPADLRPTAPSNNLIPRGPLTSDTPERSDEFPVKSMTESEIDALQQLIQTVLDGALDAPVGRKVCITDQFIRGGTYIHGDLTNPKIVIVSAPNDQNAKVRALSTQPPCTTGPGDGVNNLVIENGAVFQGAGVLILPRELDIKDATFDWKGLVLIMENGKIVALKDACGGICGGLLLQTSNDRNNARLDFDKNEARSTCGAANGAFSLSRCCDALDITIRILTHTLSWTERFEG